MLSTLETEPLEHVETIEKVFPKNSSLGLVFWTPFSQLSPRLSAAR